MKIFKHKISLWKEILSVKNLSFIPTMGDLHNGHIYLIKKAKRKNCKVIVSLFVNPKQFNSKKDFKSYPKDIKKDLKILKKLKVNYVYIPSFRDIYNFKPKNKIYLDKFSKKLCGKFRKNHFLGVVNVVNRLLEIINPRFIYLGKKDYQQLYLITRHLKKRNILTKVIPCKTIREKNGVACSSRNKNLTTQQIKIASNVYKLIKKNKLILKKSNNFKFKFMKISNYLKKLGVTKLDYLEMLNVQNLKKPKSKNEKFNIFIAYHLKNTRLIDNV